MPPTVEVAADGESATISVRDAISLAMQRYESGDLVDAAHIYQAILEVYPEEVDALHFLGITEHQLGRSDLALSHLDRALALVSDSTVILNNRGNVLRSLGRLDEAEADYRRALDLCPEHVGALSNLGALQRVRGDYEGAVATLRKGTSLAPTHAPAWQNLGNALECLDRDEEALAAYREAARLLPESGIFFLHVGMSLFRLGRLEEAARAYRHCLELSPNNPRALHLLAACGGQAVPARASSDYVRAEFDGFAANFDAILARLEYRGPTLVGEAVTALLGSHHAGVTVLDAGCGTGLCGPVLRAHAATLVGVDLSASMVALARRRGLYDSLVVGDLVEFLCQNSQSFDLVVSADTLIYFGELGDVAAAVVKALRPGGSFVFTLERSEEDDAALGYRLQPHGRYSHARAYVERVLANAGFVNCDLGEVTIRKESRRWVPGWLVSARVQSP